jgi:hypothetical protein
MTKMTREEKVAVQSMTLFIANQMTSRTVI